MENVYYVEIGTHTRKGHFQSIVKKCVKSNSSREEVSRYFTKQYHGLDVCVSDVDLLEIVRIEKEITRKFSGGTVFLANKQYFNLSEFLATDQLERWKKATREKAIVDTEAENIVREKLKLRTEVKNVKEINLNESGGLSCMIEINGEIWKI